MEKRELSPSTPIGSLIPYYLKNTSGEPWSYNDIPKWGQYAAIRDSVANKDPFEVNQGGDIPFEYEIIYNPYHDRANFIVRVFQHSPGDIVKAAIEPLRKKLREDLESITPGKEGWELLMEYDKLTTRQFLGQ